MFVLRVLDGALTSVVFGCFFWFLWVCYVCYCCGFLCFRGLDFGIWGSDCVVSFCFGVCICGGFLLVFDLGCWVVVGFGFWICCGVTLLPVGWFITC